jgi:hypothetical protein
VSSLAIKERKSTRTDPSVLAQMAFEPAVLVEVAGAFGGVAISAGSRQLLAHP